MSYSPTFDAAIVLFMLFYGLGAIAFIVVVIVETIILWQMNWGTFTYSLWTSFLMNLASTLAGYFLIRSIPELILLLNYGVTFLLLFAVSLAIEGGIMLAMKKPSHKAKPVWQIVIATNIITYSLLAIGFILLFSRAFS